MAHFSSFKDPIILYSTNSFLDRAAVDAVLKFEYKPRFVNGRPVEVTGVGIGFMFDVEDSGKPRVSFGFLIEPRNPADLIQN